CPRWASQSRVLRSPRRRSMWPWRYFLRHPKGRPSRQSRPGRRSRSRPLVVEQLEDRLTPSSGLLASNLALTTNPDVQQMPSIAADPLDSQHLVVSYMDRSLVTTG